MNDLSHTDWHGLPVGRAVELLESDARRGLDAEEAVRRLVAFEPNQMSAGQRTPPWLRFLLQFHQPLIYILLGATVTSGLLGEWVDASVIFGVVLVNALIGYIQDSK